MTIVSGGKEWSLSIYILAGYIAVGFVILFVLPDGVIPAGVFEVSWGLFGRVSAIASDHNRVSLFCAWMVFIFPVMFVAFSIFSPVKLKHDARADFATFAILAIGFLLFGIISAPCIIYYIGMGDVSTNSLSRLDRLACGMMRDDSSLFLGASMLLSGALAVMWISYVAIPVSFIKLIRRFWGF